MEYSRMEELTLLTCQEYSRMKELTLPTCQGVLKNEIINPVCMPGSTQEWKS